MRPEGAAAGLRQDGIPQDLHCFADVHRTDRFFAQMPEVGQAPHSGRGRRPTRLVPSQEPQEVQAIVEATGEWASVVLGMGPKGPIVGNEKVMRAFEVRELSVDSDAISYFAKKAMEFWGKAIGVGIRMVVLSASMARKLLAAALDGQGVDKCLNKLKYHLKSNAKAFKSCFKDKVEKYSLEFEYEFT